MLECDEPQTTSSSVGSSPRSALAVSLARWPYSAADLVTDLPGAVHLVAQAPETAVPRLLAAVLRPQVRPVGAALVVDIFDEGARLVEPARAEIDRQHHLGAGLLAQSANSWMPTWLDSVVRQARSSRLGRWSLRADPVFPVVGGHEVAAGIAADRRVERANQVEHVPRMPCASAVGWPGLVDAGIDRAAEMFEERAVEPLVDLGDV
jgi:hypothetical protein